MHEQPADPSEQVVDDVKAGRKSVRKQRVVEWTISLIVIFVLLMLLLPASRTPRHATRRSACKNNLKQIGLALHNYHDTWGALPPAYTVDAAGRPLHSWRTLILPYLDQQELYNTIDLTKAWDDPVNAEARRTPLTAYHCPSDPNPKNHTNYIAIVGEDFAISPTRPRPISEFTDGTSNTILVIEAPHNQTWEWMAPRDGGEQQFLNAFQMHQEGIQGLFCDGAVRYFPESLSQESRRALMTIAGDDTPAAGWE